MHIVRGGKLENKVGWPVISCYSYQAYWKYFNWFRKP